MHTPAIASSSSLLCRVIGWIGACTSCCRVECVDAVLACLLLDCAYRSTYVPGAPSSYQAKTTYTGTSNSHGWRNDPKGSKQGLVGLGESRQGEGLHGNYMELPPRHRPGERLFMAGQKY